MSWSYNIDFRKLIILTAVIATAIILVVVSVFTVSNIYGRVSKLTEARNYISKADVLEANQTAKMKRYQDLKKIITELAKDAEKNTYNLRVARLLDKLKEYQIEINNIEYGNQSSEGQISYLPVKIKLAGRFNNIMRFISLVENEVSVLGFTKLEVLTTGASSTGIEIEAIINLYRLGL